MVTLVRLVHAAYVAFFVTAPVWVLYAGLARARWSRPLQVAHGAALGFIALQYACGWACPLSVLENRLAGRPPEEPFLPIDGAEPVVAAIVLGYLAMSALGHGVALHRAGR